MPEDELPTLPHEIASPGEFLPGTPLWVWITLGLAAFIMIAGLVWIVRKLAKNSHSHIQNGATDPYQEAYSKLSTLEQNQSNQPLALVATETSLILRGCISRVLDDPALFETDKEQAQRLKEIPSIPPSISNLLHQLVSVKYAPSHRDEARAKTFADQGRAALQDFKQTHEELANKEAATK